jgi:cystathionine beta-lyase
MRVPLTTISDMPRKDPIATAWTTKLIHPTRSAPEGFRSLMSRRDVEAVLHPALPSCPGHETWKRDFTGSSGVFSVVFRPPLTRQHLHAAMDRLRLFRMGLSWGGVASLVFTPDLEAAAYAKEYGDRLVRFYIGLEDPDDLIADLESAFSGTPGLSIT